jgi:4'-phosphopantetheinyl transferase
MNELATLSATEVQVWRFSLFADAATQTGFRELLSGDELQRAARFHLERDRRRFTVRRAVLRQILGAECGCAPKAIQITASPTGKPGLGTGIRTRGLQFSCSHSADIGLVALAHGRAIGVDIEVHRPIDASLRGVIGFFAPAEQEALRQIPPDEKVRAFFDCWTCKEAVVKALGTGLTLPLNRFELVIVPGAAPKLTSLEGDLGAGERWQLLALDMGAGISGALAVEGNPATVRCQAWDLEFTSEQ